jgi:hypothetical protein
MTGIARDETRHAALAWAVARWADTKLTPNARARVERAKRTAIEDLRREAAFPIDRALARDAGLPSAADAIRLLRAMERSVWA